jgi:polyhydroxybutyrate depolymerase
MNYKIGLLLISIIFNFTISYAQYDSIPYGGYDRTYNLHLPTGYTGSTSIPLIIALHGGGHSAIEIESMSGLSLKADLENFIVVYPEGVKGPLSNARTWNAGECCGYASFANIDDVGFIDALITILTSQYNIDTTRIHATGVSNGGFFAYRLACELSNKIASIAPVASSMTLDYCTPDRPVSIIHFHSVNDTRVPYQGGVGSGFATHYNPPIDSILNIWSNINVCLNIDETIISNGLYTYRNWSNCECGNEIIYYLTQDGGHSWPGGIPTATGDSVSNYINATDLMWDFFQQHTIDDVYITVADILVILSEFGCTSACTSDIDGDGSVTVSDVLDMLSLFGSPC